MNQSSNDELRVENERLRRNTADLYKRAHAAERSLAVERAKAEGVKATIRPLKVAIHASWHGTCPRPELAALLSECVDEHLERLRSALADPEPSDDGGSLFVAISHYEREMDRAEAAEAKVARVEDRVAEWWSCGPRQQSTRDVLKSIESALAGPEPEACPDCGGAGLKEDPDKSEDPYCQGCGGSGYLGEVLAGPEPDAELTFNAMLADPVGQFDPRSEVLASIVDWTNAPSSTMSAGPEPEATEGGA